jgi:predicted transcriptional regulator
MSLWKPKRKVSERPVADFLGPLEREILEVLWSRGRSNVRDVVQSLERQLAYTTVMTTLDRLFKKGLLQREKAERAFFYAPVHSRMEWEQRRVGLWLSHFLTREGSSSCMLLSCLIDAVGEHDEALLDELERQIAIRRRQIESKDGE